MRCVSFLVVAGNSSQNENTFWFPMSSFYEKFSVVYHPKTGHQAGISKLPALAGWYIWLVLRKSPLAYNYHSTNRDQGQTNILTNFFCLAEIWRELCFWTTWLEPYIFLKKGAGMHQKGGQCPPFEWKRGSRQIYISKCTNQVFLWYRLVQYQENTNQYRPKTPNCKTTLEKFFSGYNIMIH